jgi:hypothetical protein
MDQTTTQNLTNIVNVLETINTTTQKFFDSEIFKSDENTIMNMEIRKCLYIHGWDRCNKRFYRAVDVTKLSKDLQIIIDKYNKLSVFTI